MRKRCSWCGKRKLLDQFHIASTLSHGRASLCKPCKAKYGKAYYQKRKAELDWKTCNNRMLHDYGIDSDDYERLLESQSGRCAICTDPPKPGGQSLHVDHNHETSEIRGLLCSLCNKGLGCFRDNAHILARAFNYRMQTQ